MMLKPVLAAALTASFLMVGGCASKPDASGGLQAYAPCQRRRRYCAADWKFNPHPRPPAIYCDRRR